MRRFALHSLFVGLLMVASGCAIGASPDDEAYPAYGGIVQRQDPYRGRVGSAFDSGVATVSHFEEIEGEYSEEWAGEETMEAFDAPPIEEIPPPAASEAQETPTSPEVFYE